MAKTGDIYAAVEEMKDAAVSAHGGLESNDDLDALIEDLAGVSDRATAIRGVALNVRDALKELP